MKIAFHIWFRSVWIFFVCMTPALFYPPIFVVAVLLATLCGIPALFLFIPAMVIIKRVNPSNAILGFVLVTLSGLGLCFAATCGACWLVSEGEQDVFEAMDEWLLFPFAGWLSVAVSIVTHHSSIRNYFSKTPAYEI